MIHAPLDPTAQPAPAGAPVRAPFVRRGSTRTVNEVLSTAEIRALTERSDLRGWLSVGTTWGILAGAFALAGLWPNPLTIALAVILIGGRQLALAILMHECAHSSLFRSRRLNDLVGEWLCAAPSWGHLKAYRKHHIAHHAHTGTDRDTDISLVRPFPVGRGSLVRKLLRDLTGLSGLKRVYGQLLMDLGYLRYTAASDVTPIDQRGRRFSHVLRTGLRNLGPVILTNGVLFGILWAVGAPWLYGLWWIANLTTFSLFVRLRSMAEHACTEQSADPFRNTRTTLANPVARLTVAPHHVNYHLEHHLVMTVPHYRLPEMHRMLRERQVFDTDTLAGGYAEILRRVVRPAQVV